MKIGAFYNGKQTCEFTVWAPIPDKVELKIRDTEERIIPMKKDKKGYWNVVATNVSNCTEYTYLLNGDNERPDPASFFQPHGVHQSSQVIDHRKFHWRDDKWTGISLKEMIIYEVHIGTFTNEGTFEAIVPRLKNLKELGINAIEIMPVAQFPGERNWGYDGVFPFAVQNSYGSPDSLKKLVNECHRLGIAVILDVVYNHLGPEGNYLRDFGPYFTDKYKTPWGEALNFDDEYSDEVRNYFIENALYWFHNFHIDALRLDAIHAIYDMSARPFLQELSERVEKFSVDHLKKFHLIAESDLNNSRVIRPREVDGFGLDAQWSDDFHHSVHALLTAEKEGYYLDFGETKHLEKSLKNGLVYTGEYSKYRKRRHGNSFNNQLAHQFVVAIQNHDQVGNRMLGERLSHLISFEGLKLAAGILLLSPYIPLIFMGEEFGESAPFLYFVSHGDPDLIHAVREGRKSEFKSFHWKGEPPDPQSVDTFFHSKINWDSQKKGKHKILRDFYKKLIQLRKETPACSHFDKDSLRIHKQPIDKLIIMHRWHEGSEIIAIYNLNKELIQVELNLPAGNWKKVLDSSDKSWQGSGAELPKVLIRNKQYMIKPLSMALYFKE